MAPEQATGSSGQIGPWTDIYCLGVVLYRMLIGRMPFEGQPVRVLYQIAHEPPPAPSSLRSDLDPALEAILMKALAKDPKDRYQTAREFGQVLASPCLTGGRSSFDATPLLSTAGRPFSENA